MCTCLGLGFCFGLAWNDWVWCGMSETGWRIALYVTLKLKDLCTLKETKQTSVNNEPIGFSSEASDIQILCELKCRALFLIMETWCRPGIDKAILMQESWPLENDKEKDK